jgi:uncharacterized protein (DUF302 family)
MTVEFGKPGAETEAFQLIRTTSRPFQQVLDSVRPEIGAAGMKVLHEIDPQAALQGFGHTIGGARLVFFFHPNLLHRLLEADWTAIVEAPPKLALLELPDGTVSLRMANPAGAFARYGNPALTAFGTEFGATCARIVDASV